MSVSAGSAFSSVEVSLRYDAEVDACGGLLVLVELQAGRTTQPQTIVWGLRSMQLCPICHERIVMLLPFFNALRAAGLPVSLKEHPRSPHS